MSQSAGRPATRVLRRVPPTGRGILLSAFLPSRAGRGGTAARAARTTIAPITPNATRPLLMPPPFAAAGSGVEAGAVVGTATGGAIPRVNVLVASVATTPAIFTVSRRAASLPSGAIELVSVSTYWLR